MKFKPSSQAPRIALLGPFSSRNLGDTATQMAVMQNLVLRQPAAHFIGISPEPDDTLHSLGMPAFPLSGLGPAAGNATLTRDTSLAAQAQEPKSRSRRGLSSIVAAATLAFSRVWRMAKWVRSLDLLIISGGGQLDDFWGGAWGHPWSMLLWAALARMNGVPVVFLGVGLDHLDTTLSQHFAVRAMRWAQRRIFRDSDSRQALIGLGLTQVSSVCPDLAFSLQMESTDAAPATPFVVLSPISLKTWSHSQTQAHDRYLDGLAETGAALAQRGYALRIACSQPSMDTSEAQALMQRLEARGVQAQLCHTPQVRDFMHQVQGAELVVASRLHAAILSLVSGCPVLALSHLPKVSSLMRDAGLADYCVALQNFSAPDLTQRALRALDQVGPLRTHVRSTSTQWRNQLQSTFDDVVTLLEH